MTLTIADVGKAYSVFEADDGEPVFVPCGHKVILSTGVVVIRSLRGNYSVTRAASVDPNELVCSKDKPKATRVKTGGLSEQQFRERFGVVFCDLVDTGLRLAEIL